MTCVRCGLPTEVITAGGVEEGLCLECLLNTIDQPSSFDEENLQALRDLVEAALKKLSLPPQVTSLDHVPKNFPVIKVATKN